MTDYILDFPDFLLPPQPLNDNYAQVLPSRVARTEMEQGLARQRRKVRSGPTQLLITLSFTPDQYRLFTGFFDVVDGGLFTLPVFRDNTYIVATGQIVKDSVKSARSGGEWLVSFVFETMTRLAPDQDEIGVQILTAGSGMSLSEIIDLLDHAVNVEYPETVS